MILDSFTNTNYSDSDYNLFLINYKKRLNYLESYLANSFCFSNSYIFIQGARGI